MVPEREKHTLSARAVWVLERLRSEMLLFASINVWIDEVEEEKTLDAIKRHPRKRLNDRIADCLQQSRRG